MTNPTYITKPLGDMTQNQETFINHIQGMFPIFHITVSQLDSSKPHMQLNTVSHVILVQHLILKFGYIVSKNMIDIENDKWFMQAITKHCDNMKPGNVDKVTAVISAADDFLQKMKDLELDDHDMAYISSSVGGFVNPLLNKLRDNSSNRASMMRQNMCVTPANHIGNQLLQLPNGIFPIGPGMFQMPAIESLDINDPNFINKINGQTAAGNKHQYVFSDFVKIADSLCRNGTLEKELIQKIAHYLDAGKIHVGGTQLRAGFNALVNIMSHPFEGNPQFIIDGNNVIIC